MFIDVLAAPLHKRANRGRRGIEDRRLVALDDLPKPILFREVGRAFVEDARRAERERTVDDIRVPRHPADIGRTPENVAFFKIEDEARRRCHAREIARGRMHDAFRLCRRAARVEQEEQVFGFHRFGRAYCGLVAYEIVPPDIATVAHRNGIADAFGNDTVLYGWCLLERDVDRRFKRHFLSATPTLIGRDDGDAFRVLHAVDDRIGGEAAEYHAMRRADTRAREQRDGKLGHHRHVDRDTIAAFDAELTQTIREFADVLQEFGIRDGPPIAGLAFKVICNTVATARLDMAVETIDRRVERSAAEPLREGLVPFQNRLEGFAPGELLSPRFPKPEVIAFGFLVDAGLGVCRSGKGRYGRKRPRFLEEGFDGLMGVRIRLHPAA